MKNLRVHERWVQAKVCENASIQAYRILPGGCYDEIATREVRVSYTRNSLDNTEIFHLCKHCANRLKDDAESHGYTCAVTRMRPRIIKTER